MVSMYFNNILCRFAIKLETDVDSYCATSKINLQQARLVATQNNKKNLPLINHGSIESNKINKKYMVGVGIGMFYHPSSEYDYTE